MGILLHIRWLAFAYSATAWQLKIVQRRAAPCPWNQRQTLGSFKSSNIGQLNMSHVSKPSYGRSSAPNSASPGRHEGLSGGPRESSAQAASFNIMYDEFFLKHRPPPGHPHPECPARVSTARTELDDLEGITWCTPSSLTSEEGKAATVAAIERVHKLEFLDEIKGICAKGGGAADFDTYVCPDTFEVCVAASSAWMDAVESAQRGTPAFALTRPPGHHATAGVAMGFCVVCFAAVAAYHAVETLGCTRVAMLDFDVHHGNGVAASVKNDERIRYCSIHQGGTFPGSGAAEDAGPLGNLKHLPFFGEGETWDTYEKRFEQALIWLKEFEPSVLIVSAGYDALEADELATASLQPEDFGRMGKRLREEFGDKVAFGLEGGYNLQVTPKAIRETIEAFLTHEPR